jgi:hypothetical protein
MLGSLQEECRSYVAASGHAHKDDSIDVEVYTGHHETSTASPPLWEEYGFGGSVPSSGTNRKEPNVEYVIALPVI